VGEVVTDLAAGERYSVEQILSGEIHEPVEYLQDHDEWVAIVEGAAVVEVEGEALDLGPGDWLWLPAQTPHRVLSTRAGTSWIAVRSAPHGE
jgi:mannose-6-phosphate isomerase-like protein (cupin superfamily)